jgi:hypothetical protein
MDNKNQKTANLNEHIILTVKNKHPKTIQQLVELVHQKHPLPQKEIIEHILNLQKQGKLTLKEDTTHIPMSLKSYISSSYSYWYWAIITLALATTATVFIIPENAYPIIYTRYILGSIFVIFLPGYAFTKVLFPTKELESIERVALSIGMSLALVPITVLILNYTPWGIRTIPVTLSTLALTTILATAAVIREYQTKTTTHPKGN